MNHKKTKMIHFEKIYGDTKKCGICDIEKPTSEFWKRKKNGRETCRMECKKCSCNRRTELYRTKNREKVLARNKEYIETRKEYKRDYDRKRADRMRIKRNQQRLAHYHMKKKSDSGFRMLRALRARMYFSVTNGIKCDKTVALIGCDIETLKKHIEGMFSVGMNWDNYGRNGWHIDHIKPCAKFDLSNEIEQRECFHYTNLQPLWEPDNCKKGAKYSQLEYKAK